MEHLQAFMMALGDYFVTATSSLFDIFFAPGAFLGVWPILVAILVGACVLKARKPQASLIEGLFPKDVFLHRSAKHDYALLAINEGLLFFVSASSIFTSVFVASALLSLIGKPLNVSAPPASAWMLGAFTIFSLLVWDFAASWTHYLKHRIPLLWEFHKVHHSAAVMTPITAMRRHPMERVITEVIINTVIGISLAVWVLVFGAPGSVATIFGVNAGIFAWRLLGYNLRDSHIWIDYGPFWSRVFISPAQHHIHHSNDPRHYDSNFGHIFAIWDRMFGTLYIPQGQEDITFGIDAKDMAEHATLRGLYLTPFRGALRRFRPARKATKQAVSDYAV